MNEIVSVADKPIRQCANVRELLVNKQAMDQLGKVAAKHMNPERMMRVMANAIRTTPKLAECDPLSMLGALMNCAALGLEPNTPLGHAYLIPFKNNKKGITEVQMVVGYKGLIDLARRSGQLASIHADVVYSDDELFSHEYGSNQHLRHRPGPRKGKRLGAYAYVKLNLGDGITAEGHRYMTMDEIIAHRNTHSKNWQTAVKFGKTAESLWDEKNPAFESMATKTVVRALANRGELPMSIEFISAMEQDEQKADFARYAINPEDGLTIDGTADALDDGAVDEGDTPAQVEDKTPPPKAEPRRREPAPKAEPKPVHPDTPAQAKPAPQEAQQADTLPLGDVQPKDAQKAPSGENWVRFYDQVIADALAGGPGPAKTHHAEKLEAMRQEAPAMHEELLAELAQFPEDEGGDE